MLQSDGSKRTFSGFPPFKKSLIEKKREGEEKDERNGRKPREMERSDRKTQVRKVRKSEVKDVNTRAVEGGGNAGGREE